MMMLKLIGLLLTVPLVYMMYVAFFQGFSSKTPVRIIEWMFYGAIICFFLGIMAMVSCQVAPVCKTVCAPSYDGCKRVCKPEEEWL